MAGGTFKSMDAAMRSIERDVRSLESRLDKGRRRAAQKTAAYLRKHIPVAFGELRDSVHEKDGKVIVDAPYAMAVELGSRPHVVPIEALIKWVKLRGFQSLVGPKSRARLPGTTTQHHANSVGKLLSRSRGTDKFTTTEAVYAIARGIQIKIASKGTKPQHFMLKAVPIARVYLAIEITDIFSKQSE